MDEFEGHGPKLPTYAEPSRWVRTANRIMGFDEARLCAEYKVLLPAIAHPRQHSTATSLPPI